MKRVISTCLTLCLSAALALPASALDYSIDAPGNPDYGDPTSIEVVHTADGGAMKNEDISKNAALIPPSFGSPSADALGTGTYLTPQLGPWRHGGWYYLRRQYAHRIPAYVWRKHRQYQLWQFWRIQYLWRLYLCDR